MDAFLSELFDVTGVDHTLFTDPATGGLSHAAIMRDPRLIRNAEFRFAWSQLSGGALPSARCFAEFQRSSSSPGTIETLGEMTDWMLTSMDGPFHMMQGTSLIQKRLSALRTCFEEHAKALRDPTCRLLHRLLVEKLLDRHTVWSHKSELDVDTQMHRPLYLVYRDLTWRAGVTSTLDQMTNPASGMIASHEEEQTDGQAALACHALLRVGRGDAMKRRFARDLHFQKSQFGRPYVTSSTALGAHAEVVRLAVGAPWFVDDRDACEVEQHSPVIASACIRLHDFRTRTLAPPSAVSQGAAGHTTSMLILFGTGAETPDAEIARYGSGLGYQRIFRASTASTAPDTPHCLDSSSSTPPLVYTLYFGTGEHWSSGILGTSLRRHLVTPCPLQSLNPLHAHLLVDRCVVRVAISRGLFTMPTFATSLPCLAKRVILAIDTRMDPCATVLSLLIALSSVATPKEWAVRIMCSRRNRFEFERMLGPMCPCATYDDTAPELNSRTKAFDVQYSYNLLMKNPDTWRALLPAEVVLTVQDDGLLIRKGIESLWDTNGWVYLGAPWADKPFNSPLKALVPSLIGNGGLSLRDVAAMISMSEGVTKRERMRLFHTRLEPVPEDVMFASLAALLPSPTQAQAARSFSCEQVPFPEAHGFHKPWPYWSVADTHEHMERIISASVTAMVDAL